MAAKVKNENYTTIQGFMINELKLSGNELIAYAVIYGFSQAEGQYMTCSQEYIGNWCNLSKSNTNRLLKRLVDKGLIEKKLAKTKGAVKLYDYKAVTSAETATVTSAKTATVTSAKTTHHNKRYNNNISKKNSFKNFEQREYTKEDYKNMERMLLQKK